MDGGLSVEAAEGADEMAVRVFRAELGGVFGEDTDAASEVVVGERNIVLQKLKPDEEETRDKHELEGDLIQAQAVTQAPCGLIVMLQCEAS